MKFFWNNLQNERFSLFGFSKLLKTQKFNKFQNRPLEQKNWVKIGEKFTKYSWKCVMHDNLWHPHTGAKPSIKYFSIRICWRQSMKIFIFRGFSRKLDTNSLKIEGDEHEKWQKMEFIKCCLRRDIGSEDICLCQSFGFLWSRMAMMMSQMLQHKISRH